MSTKNILVAQQARKVKKRLIKTLKRLDCSPQEVQAFIDSLSEVNTPEELQEKLFELNIIASRKGIKCPEPDI